MTLRSFVGAMLAGAGIGLLSACMSLDGTTDLTEAPTRTSTGSTHSTSDFTSSTTPKSWFAGDGTVKTEHKIRTLTVFTYYNLKDNIAQGSGEYLASLAVLAGIHERQHADFFRFAQRQYGFIYAEDIKPAESVDRLIQTLSGPS